MIKKQTGFTSLEVFIILVILATMAFPLYDLVQKTNKENAEKINQYLDSTIETSSNEFYRWSSPFDKGEKEVPKYILQDIVEKCERWKKDSSYSITAEHKKGFDILLKNCLSIADELTSGTVKTSSILKITEDTELKIQTIYKEKKEIDRKEYEEKKRKEEAELPARFQKLKEDVK